MIRRFRTLARTIFGPISIDISGSLILLKLHGLNRS